MRLTQPTNYQLPTTNYHTNWAKSPATLDDSYEIKTLMLGYDAIKLTD